MKQDAAVVIEEQLKHCRELLTAFQEERKQFVSSNSISPLSIIESLKKKKVIADLVYQQQSVLKQVLPTQNEQIRKKLRELATLLEQLLVIEQENEMLFKKFLKEKASSSQDSPLSSPKQGKTSSLFAGGLSRPLPFIPEQFRQQKTKEVLSPSKNNYLSKYI